MSKPRPTGLRSPPHSIVKKLAISRVRKTQQQKKEEPQMAPVAGPAAVPSAVELQKRTEPEARPTPSALAVTEQKREAGAIGKSSTSLPPCTGMAGGVDGCCGNWLPGYCICYTSRLSVSGSVDVLIDTVLVCFVRRCVEAHDNHSPGQHHTPQTSTWSTSKTTIHRVQ